MSERLPHSLLERDAEIRYQLRPPHRPGLIGDVDPLIAVTALERHVTMVRVNADFQRVPGLNVRLVSQAQWRQR